MTVPGGSASSILPADLDPARRPYRPCGAARELFHRRDGELLISGPSGTGKSRGVCEKLSAAAMKYPGMRALMVRKTRASMSESVLVTFEDHVLPVGSPVLNGPHRSYRSHYSYPNGSTIVVCGLDVAERIMSTDFDMVAAFEATELIEDDWERLMTRLRNGAMPYQQGIADCNPSAPTHWLKQRADAGVMRHLVSRHEDNPLLHDGTDWTPEGQVYLSRLDQLTGLRYERLRVGKWVGAEGQVYADFDPRVHVVDPFEVPRWWRRIRSVDFGFTNPFVCQWWAIDGDGRMYLYREIYRKGQIVNDLAVWINDLTTEKIAATVADHDAEGRENLHRNGIHSVCADKRVEIGVQVVQARLRVQGDGKPRLFFFSDALVERDPELARDRKPLCTIQELPMYCWQQPKADGSIKETPIDAHDHGCDAMRYAVMYVDCGSGVPLPTARIPNPPKNPRWVYELDRRHVERLYKDNYHRAHRSFQ